MKKQRQLVPGDFLVHAPSAELDVIAVSAVDGRGVYMTSPFSRLGKGVRLEEGSLQLCKQDRVDWSVADG